MMTMGDFCKGCEHASINERHKNIRCARRLATGNINPNFKICNWDFPKDFKQYDVSKCSKIDILMNLSALEKL